MPLSSLAAVLLTAVLGAEPAPVAPVRPFESPADLTPAGKIDELVFARLKKLGVQPAPLCSDAVFVRRAFLDVIGTLPTAAEARDFLTDRNPQKRGALIDRLLERDELADYQAMKWSDVLRIKAEFPINLWPNAAQAYYHWVRTSIRDNKPYDRFARELLTSSGSNFRMPPVNFYRAIQSRQPTAIAQAVALALMGARADKWPQERLAGMSVFFSKIGYKATAEWKEEIVFFDPTLTSGKPGDKKAPAKTLTDTNVAATAVFPDGTPARIPPDRDPREVFADWLIDAKNPWFARNIVNRQWCWLVGRGIIHEPDDIRPDNPPSNPELLAYLEHELVASHYDLKHVERVILNSKTYQLSSLSRVKGSGVVVSEENRGGHAKQRLPTPLLEANFASYPLRRLEAEVLIDAICQVTGTREKYTSAIPEPYTFLPESHRSIALPDGSITSPFLDKFGRPPRDTGFESERNNRISASQRLEMLNSTHIQRKLEESPRLQGLMYSGLGPQRVIENLYLTILSRFPTEEEWKVIERHAERGERKARREAFIDLAWALINSAEFMYRH